jgi:hypothetical protein
MRSKELIIKSNAQKQMARFDFGYRLHDLNLFELNLFELNFFEIS